MNIEIQSASVNDKSVLRNLIELCQHDYSEYDNADVDEHGLFGYKYLDNYWTEPGRHPFLVRVAGKLVGFVLVRAIDSQDKPATHAITEFWLFGISRGIPHIRGHGIIDEKPRRLLD